MIDAAQKARLVELRKAGKSITQCAELLGCTRGQAAGLSNRLLNGYRRPKDPPKRASVGGATNWTEAALTETWEQRKARRAKEREARLQS